MSEKKPLLALPPSADPEESGTEPTQVSSEKKARFTPAPPLIKVTPETLEDALTRAGRSTVPEKTAAAVAIAVPFITELRARGDVAIEDLKLERERRHEAEKQIERLTERLNHIEGANRARELVLALASMATGTGFGLLFVQVAVGAALLVMGAMLFAAFFAGMRPKTRPSK